MINLLVDEAYAFDYLSILEVKKEKNPQNYNTWLQCYKILSDQFDPKKWSLMINSEEYKQMIVANLHTFEAVDKAKRDEVSAKYVDECNYERYVAKQKFQSKFFDSKLCEQKIGYEVYSKR